MQQKKKEKEKKKKNRSKQKGGGNDDEDLEITERLKKLSVQPSDEEESDHAPAPRRGKNLSKNIFAALGDDDSEEEEEDEEEERTSKKDKGKKIYCWL
ncbi:hypothetical protein AB205_0112510 [Aquarana catesbeiana]|uniref:Uncharacterized protein n=1 Tax=Aquarana catesbeiana TaxID=8400 RepID=A0A2G9SCU3_AQUCT|nr:hypothetical protein AB205_0112510 [Aquarana catesbeiana]